MNKPERHTNCRSETDVGGIGGRWLFARDGVRYDSGSINYSCHTNSRVWISDLDGNGHINCEEEILQVKDYYPFGMPHDLPEEVDLPSLPYRDADPFTYNNKEYEDRVTRMHDYHARWYDAALGRWNAVDPLAEHPNQIHISPYAYAWNNPILLNDPDGLCPDCGGNVAKLVAYPYKVIGTRMGQRAEKAKIAFDAARNVLGRHLIGGYFITSHFSTVGGEDNVRQGDGDHIDNIIDDSAQSMGYASIRDNYLNTESLDVENLPNSPDDLIEVVTSPESRTVTPSDGSYSTEGSRTENDISTEVEDDRLPGRGITDSIRRDDGSLWERQRDPKTGILIQTLLNLD